MSKLLRSLIAIGALLWLSPAEAALGPTGVLEFNSAGLIVDSNENELIEFPSTVASAVNHFGIANAATGVNPTFSATGGDTNIGMTLSAKGGFNFSLTQPPFLFNTGNQDFGPVVFRNSGDANGGTGLVFYHDSSTPANADNVGFFEAQGRDSAANNQYWAGFKVVIDDVTSTSEDGRWTLETISGGSRAARLSISGGATFGYSDSDPGVGNLAVDDSGEFRLYETEANGDNYFSLIAPGTLSGDVTCTIDSSGRIPDSCVGDGTDAGGAGSQTPWTSDIDADDFDLADVDDLRIGNTESEITIDGTGNRLQIAAGTAEYAAALQAYSANAFGAGLVFSKSRNATLGSHTVVQSGDALGGMEWFGSDGTDYEYAASIGVLVDGTPNDDSTDMPGRLELKTTLDGSDSATTRLVIKNDGGVILGTDSTSPGAGNLKFGTTGKGIFDANANELLLFTATASAVNEITLANAATAGTPTFSATGGDSNIAMGFASKGDTVTIVTGVSANIYFDTGASNNGVVLTRNTNAGANGILHYTFADSASPAASDTIVEYKWVGRDSGGNLVQYGDIFNAILDPTDGSEDSQITIAPTVAGTAGAQFRLSAGAIVGNSTTYPGAGSLALDEDLFLGSGDKIDFNAGDVTLTHASGQVIFDGAGNGYVFAPSAFEPVVIGNNTSVIAAGSSLKLQVQGISSSAAFGIARFSDDAFPAKIIMAKSRAAIGLFTTIVQNGDQLGRIAWTGADGTDASGESAVIAAFIDGAPGATDDMPARLSFQTAPDATENATERMSIDSGPFIVMSGGGFSVQPICAFNGACPGVQVLGDDIEEAGIGIGNYQNNAADGAWTAMGHSRGTSAGSYTVVQADDNMSQHRYYGADGDEFIEGARISTFVDGTPGNDDMPGRIELQTTADAAQTPTTRMVIKNDGGVILGTNSTSPGAGNLKFGTTGKGIFDANANESLLFTATASAVNEITVANAATGTPPGFSATGGDTDIGMKFAMKGGLAFSLTNPAFLFEMGSQDTPNVLWKGTSSGFGGPSFSFFHDSASPAANDSVGRFDIYGRDSGANAQFYAGMGWQLLDPTDGSEDTRMQLEGCVAGNCVQSLLVGDGTVIGTSTALPGRGALLLADSLPGSGAGGEIRLGEDTDNGANFIAIRAPATITSDQTCVLENDANPIPDSCVGDGTDGGGGLSDNDYGDITVSSGGTVWNLDADVVTPTELAEAGDYDFTGTVTLDADALQLDDTNASHQLIITPGSDLTADRVLTLTTGDAARTLTLNGNATLDDWFDQSVKTTASPTFANPTVTTLELGAAATDATLARTGAGEATLEGDAVKHAGKQMLWIPASAMKNNATSPASCGDTYDSGSNDVTITVCAFDTGATEERADFQVAMPKSWNESTVTAIPITTSTGGTVGQTVEYEIACAAVSSGDTLNTAMGTAQTSSATLPASPANLSYAGAESSAITCANTPAENDYVAFRVSRNTSVDNMTGDALLLGIKLFWTDNASTMSE